MGCCFQKESNFDVVFSQNIIHPSNNEKERVKKIKSYRSNNNITSSSKVIVADNHSGNIARELTISDINAYDIDRKRSMKRLRGKYSSPNLLLKKPYKNYLKTLSLPRLKVITEKHNDSIRFNSKIIDTTEIIQNHHRMLTGEFINLDSNQNLPALLNGANIGYNLSYKPSFGSDQFGNPNIEGIDNPRLTFTEQIYTSKDMSSLNSYKETQKQDHINLNPIYGAGISPRINANANPNYNAYGNGSNMASVTLEFCEDSSIRSNPNVRRLWINKKYSYIFDDVENGNSSNRNNSNSESCINYNNSSVNNNKESTDYNIDLKNLHCYNLYKSGTEKLGKHVAISSREVLKSPYMTKLFDIEETKGSERRSCSINKSLCEKGYVEIYII